MTGTEVRYYSQALGELIRTEYEQMAPRSEQ